jgi:tRNA pseudouridine13 synthase
MTIKRRPQEFQVEEVLTDEVRARVSREPGPFAIYRLAKQSLTTPDAVALVSRQLRVALTDISYGGLKDRHAATIQHISIRDHVGGDATLPAHLAGARWRIDQIGWIEEELTAAHIAGNKFSIMIRGLTRRVIGQMDRAARLLSVSGDLTSGRSGAIRIVNYFGDQRFGSARHGRGFIARHLIDGDFETALKLAIATPARKERRRDGEFKRMIARKWGAWNEIAVIAATRPERRAIEHLATSPDDFRGAFTKLPYFTQHIAVEAYQSHLWNAMARCLVQERCCGPDEVIEADDPFGAMVFPSPTNASAELAQLTLPLLGRRTQLIEPWKGCAERTLREEGIARAADLHIPKVQRPFFGEAPRSLFADAIDFSLGNPQRDELDSTGRRFRRRLVMTLPRGAYATVVLRALGQ